MKLKMTRDQLIEKFYDTTASNFIDFLVDSGLVLDEGFSGCPQGVYRRLDGQDLVRHDGYGNWFLVDVYGFATADRKITWSLSPFTPDWWIQVLDSLNQPVVEGVRIAMDHTGKRVG